MTFFFKKKSTTTTKKTKHFSKITKCVSFTLVTNSILDPINHKSWNCWRIIPTTKLASFQAICFHFILHDWNSRLTLSSFLQFCAVTSLIKAFWKIEKSFNCKIWLKKLPFCYVFALFSLLLVGHHMLLTIKWISTEDKNEWVRNIFLFTT